MFSTCPLVRDLFLLFLEVEMIHRFRLLDVDAPQSISGLIEEQNAVSALGVATEFGFLNEPIYGSVYDCCKEAHAKRMVVASILRLE